MHPYNQAIYLTSNSGSVYRLTTSRTDITEIMSGTEGLQITPPLSTGLGYGIIVGVGALFAIGMSALSWFLAKFFAEKQSSGLSLNLNTTRFLANFTLDRDIYDCKT
jgi:hypothetical protein